MYEYLETNQIVDVDVAARLDDQIARWVPCVIDYGFSSEDLEAAASLETGAGGEDIVRAKASETVEFDSDELRDFELRVASADANCSATYTWPVIHYQQSLFLTALVDEGLLAAPPDSLAD